MIHADWTDDHNQFTRLAVQIDVCQYVLIELRSVLIGGFDVLLVCDRFGFGLPIQVGQQMLGVRIAIGCVQILDLQLDIDAFDDEIVLIQIFALLYLGQAQVGGDSF